MKKIKRTFFIDEKGLTLVEVLASIVILSIVLMIFMSIFIQSAKTNQTSEKIVDATYIAQTEMEILYAYSREINKSELHEALIGKSYIQKAEGIFLNESYLSEGFQVQITLGKEGELTNILVEVSDSTDKQVAQMENLVKWREADE